MAKWKDTTSYSQGQERIPTCFGFDLVRLRVTVVSSHLYYPGKWIMHFGNFCDCKELGVATEKEAKAKALKIAKEYLTAELKVITAALQAKGASDA